MGKNESKRISPANLQKATSGFNALQDLKDYNPQREAFAVDKGAALAAALKQAQDAEEKANTAAATARDNAVAAEWAMSTFMQGASEQIIGQYGNDSNELQAIGYKKKSEYKPATGRRPKDGSAGKS